MAEVQAGPKKSDPFGHEYRAHLGAGGYGVCHKCGAQENSLQSVILCAFVQTQFAPFLEAVRRLAEAAQSARELIECGFDDSAEQRLADALADPALTVGLDEDPAHGQPAHGQPGHVCKGNESIEFDDGLDEDPAA